ncbi:MAG: hypothetical protein JSV80_11700 [Acidobacteriota bacterium]|nr:MAG: hypothetical protein JSV80_11700 [Acidobacteriota bacterium]
MSARDLKSVTETCPFARGLLSALFLTMILPGGLALAADVTNPADVEQLLVTRSGSDVVLDWTEVTTDAAGQAETIDFYNVYRGLLPDFVPDKTGGTNLLGTSTTNQFTDLGAADDGNNYFYLVSAVDTAGNESRTKAPQITTPPVLSGSFSDTSIDLTWTNAQPVDQVVSYKVFWGKGPGQYEASEDVELATSFSLPTPLETNVFWYSAVVAIDGNGNDSEFSNEHANVVEGRITIRAHDESELCWGASKCPPKEGEIQRADGFQIIAPASLPPAEWIAEAGDELLITVTYTMDSRLCCDASECPPGVVPDKCGNTNPGGYNPCGDPWDRTAHLALVLDDCIAAGGSCLTNNNLELMRSITPFGTDAPPPDGTGVVPPRELTLDITPYASLLTGEQHIVAHIGHYVQKGWWVTSDFYFSRRPEEDSAKNPADGIQVLFFGGANPPTANVDIPPEAIDVKTRLFTTGHGGNQRCDGGSADGESCDTGCPGGSCQNCDEFCHRVNQIIVDGVPVWEQIPWRDDCSPGVPWACWDWNACGHGSCLWPRAGWCPGYIACHHDAPCDNDLPMTEYFGAGSHTVDYNVLVISGSWSISLVLYWYE